jgi:hypothetical protein
VTDRTEFNADAARRALAYVSAEVGETFLDDAAWTFIRRAAGVDEITASPRDVIEALGYKWDEAAAWRADR